MTCPLLGRRLYVGGVHDYWVGANGVWGGNFLFVVYNLYYITYIQHTSNLQQVTN